VGSVRAALVESTWWPSETTASQKAIWAFTLVATVALTIAAIRAPIDYRALGNYGYLGVFLITLVGTGAIAFPMPYLGAIIIGGSFLEPGAVALIAGIAAAVGELTGYLIGYSGRSLLPSDGWYASVERQVKKYGAWVIFAASIVPNPFFDAMGVIAGATRLPVPLFVLACFVGKTIRFWLLATYAGKLFGL
jgi:membrane protein YqaA with SNARE-associated domain